MLPCALGATVVIAVRKCPLPLRREYLTSLCCEVFSESRAPVVIDSSCGKERQSAPRSMATLHTLSSSSAQREKRERRLQRRYFPETNRPRATDRSTMASEKRAV